MESPDKFVLLQWSTGEVAILASWAGGYLDPDSWKRSSPIVSAVVDDEAMTYTVTTQSGNQYLLRQGSVGLAGITYSIWATMEAEMERTGKKDLVRLIADEVDIDVLLRKV